MNDEVQPPSTEGVTESQTAVEPPSDFRAYNKWRETGELPANGSAPPATAAVEPPVKTEPQSGADSIQPSEEEEEDEEREPSSRRRRKIDKLTRENEQLRSALAKMQPKPTAPPEPPQPAEEPGKPRLRDFPTLEAYQEALTDWKLDQRDAARKAEAAQAEAKSAEEKVQAAWQTSEQAARTAHSDYDDIIQSVRAPEGPGVPAMRQAMLEDDAGGEILYFLATHPDEMKRIAAMQPVSAVKEIGKLAGKLSRTPEAGNQKRQVSGAPKPPAPLSRPSANPQKDDVLDENTARDFTRWNRAREAQLKGS